MFSHLLARLVLFCLVLFSSPSSSSFSKRISYPSFQHLLDSLSSNSTLPSCTNVPCAKTRTQANFSRVEVSNADLIKISPYRKNATTHGPYLISSTGIYRGQRLKYANRYVDQFLGIYYAESPQLLKRPIKKIFNYTIQNATKFSPCCLQSLMMASNLSYGSFVMSDAFDNDCLSLNIYRADLRYGEKRKAILLFSHGGSNQLGGGSLFDGSILASEGDLIVVTMNFRLNYHGFLSSGDYRLRGNYGLWDQLLAVEWIYENAHLFGGDPHRIALVGHSAGAGNVMIIPASPHSRGMIRRVISQSGTGLAPWSINRNPLKVLERFSQDFNCQRATEEEMFECIAHLLKTTDGDIYRLHLSLSIADDNPYPVIDNDFITDSIENVLQSDAFKNVDFLTGVTLNEGLYFAEYHIKHLYHDLHNQSFRERRSLHQPNTSSMISPDIIFNGNEDRKYPLKPEQMLHQDSHGFLEQFTQSNYIEKYIEANFRHGDCFLDQIKQRYQNSTNKTLIGRLTLYIDLVSDLMFNFHMVHCLNLRAKTPNLNSTNYAYIYSHRPTYKVRSLFRDQLKILPKAIGHFAELDYVFGVPLAKNYPHIHRNVNMSYYNYSADEENFSRKIIRYWSNFIRTGNPNKDFLAVKQSETEWKAYENAEHNYMFFQLNSIRNERNYFDLMYDFWWKYFQIETSAGCPKSSRTKRWLFLLSLLLSCLLFIGIYCTGRCFQKKNKDHLLANRSPAAFVPYPATHLNT